MSTINLGYQAPDYGAVPSTPVGEEGAPKKTVYPSLTVSEKPGLAKSLSVGQEITATVKLKVVEVLHRETSRSEMYGDKCRVEFEVLSMDPQGVRVESDDEDDEDGQAAFDKYRQTKEEEGE